MDVQSKSYGIYLQFISGFQKESVNLPADTFLPAVHLFVLELQHVVRRGRLPSLWLTAPGTFTPSLLRLNLINTRWGHRSMSAYLPPRNPEPSLIHCSSERSQELQDQQDQHAGISSSWNWKSGLIMQFGWEAPPTNSPHILDLIFEKEPTHNRSRKMTKTKIQVKIVNEAGSYGAGCPLMGAASATVRLGVVREETESRLWFERYRSEVLSLFPHSAHLVENFSKLNHHNFTPHLQNLLTQPKLFIYASQLSYCVRHLVAVWAVCLNHSRQKLFLNTADWHAITLKPPACYRICPWFCPVPWMSGCSLSRSSSRFLIGVCGVTGHIILLKWERCSFSWLEKKCNYW